MTLLAILAGAQVTTFSQWIKGIEVQDKVAHQIPADLAKTLVLVSPAKEPIHKDLLSVLNALQLKTEERGQTFVSSWTKAGQKNLYDNAKKWFFRDVVEKARADIDAKMAAGKQSGSEQYRKVIEQLGPVANAKSKFELDRRQVLLSSRPSVQLLLGLLREVPNEVFEPFLQDDQLVIRLYAPDRTPIPAALLANYHRDMEAWNTALLGLSIVKEGPNSAALPTPSWQDLEDVRYAQVKLRFIENRLQWKAELYDSKGNQFSEVEETSRASQIPLGESEGFSQAITPSPEMESAYRFAMGRTPFSEVSPAHIERLTQVTKFPLHNAWLTPALTQARGNEGGAYAMILPPLWSFTQPPASLLSDPAWGAGFDTIMSNQRKVLVPRDLHLRLKERFDYVKLEQTLSEIFAKRQYDLFTQAKVAQCLPRQSRSTSWMFQLLTAYGPSPTGYFNNASGRSVWGVIPINWLQSGGQWNFQELPRDLQAELSYWLMNRRTPDLQPDVYVNGVRPPSRTALQMEPTFLLPSGVPGNAPFSISKVTDYAFSDPNVARPNGGHYRDPRNFATDLFRRQQQNDLLRPWNVHELTSYKIELTIAPKTSMVWSAFEIKSSKTIKSLSELPKNLYDRIQKEKEN